MTATARPWRAEPRFSGESLNFTVILQDDGAAFSSTVATVWASVDRETSEANAALIVRAVNNHEPLLDALKACAAVCAGETFHKAGLVEALEKARAAIAAAEKV